MSRVAIVAWLTLVSLVACSSAEERAPIEPETDGGHEEPRDPDAGSPAPPPVKDAAAPDAGEPTRLPLECEVDPCFERVVSNRGSAVCALATDGRVWCWGADGVGMQTGALGRGEPVTDPVLAATPTPIPDLDSVVDLSLGYADVSCAVRSDGSVWCWGTQPLRGFSATPAPVEGLPAAEHVAVDNNAGCAIVKEDRSPWCWGPVNSWVLPEASDGTPRRVWHGTRPVRQIGLALRGEAAVLLLTEDGSIVSWGNAPGRPVSLNFGDRQPAPIESVHEARWVGSFRFIADGRAYEWGSSATDLVPRAIPQLDGDRLLEVGERIAVDADGRVFVWGFNAFGELGVVPEELAYAEAPVEVPMPAKARSVASPAGSTFCASLVDGSVVCWGRNVDGQLGLRARDGDFHPSPERIKP